MSDVVSFILWYIAISIIGLAAFPIAFRFFPGLAEKGAAFAKPLGLLLWGFFFWLLGSLGVLQNDLGGEILAFILVLICSLLLLRKRHLQDLVEWVKGNWKTLLTIELVFLTFFVVWTVVRAANPDITYTEKPMELAFINGILKSPGFPPQDPWLSGYAISYYYFGYVLVAMLIRITGVITGVGFNLTAALWYGLTAAAAYGVVYDLLKLWNARRRSSEQSSSVLSRFGALLGPIFILITSNLEGLLEIMYARHWFWNADGTSKFWNWLQVQELNVAPTTPISWLPNRPAGWLWWRASRVIQDTGITGDTIEVIDEFPFFSYLLSDLHPHVLAMPFALLAIAACLSLFARGSAQPIEDWSLKVWVKRWEFWLTALILGVMGFLNTWNFPIYVGLFCLTAAYLRIKQSGWRWKRLLEFLGMGITFAVAGVALFLPFYVGFKSQAGGLLPSLEFQTRGVNFWIMFAVLLIPIFAWVAFLFAQRVTKSNLGRGIRVAVIFVFGLWFVSLVAGAVLCAFVDWGAKLATSSSPLISNLGVKLNTAGLAFSYYVHSGADAATVLNAAVSRHFSSPGTWITLLVLFTLVLALIFSFVKKQQEESVEDADLHEVIIEGEVNGAHKIDVNGFVLILVLLGALLTFFPENFYLRDQFGTRMNTIFKFYFETWSLWGIAAAFGSVVLLVSLRKALRAIFSVTWVVLILCSFIYPIIMTLNKTNDFNPTAWTLDGNAYLARYYPDEAAAIAWLETQPMGVVSEAVQGSYTPDSEWVATQTGYPTVLGWPGHESQWRGGSTEMGNRQADIETLYTTHDWDDALTILRQYHIRYVYIGYDETITYQVDVNKFNGILTPTYQNNSVTIYEIPDSLLTPGG